jgi:hypothetical protein
MTHGLGAQCDEFYINCRLFLKLDMSLDHESILHFFDRIRKEYPSLKKLRRREGGAFSLEDESDDQGSRRWVRLESNCLKFGNVAPSDLDEVRPFGKLILTQAPYYLTLSDLVYDHLEVVYGFDLRYRGNHDKLIAETLLSEHLAGAFLFSDRAHHVLDAQPCFGIALNADCDLQAYIEVKSRTSAYEVRRENYPGSPISVHLTVRRYWGIADGTPPNEMLPILIDAADELATERIVPSFVNPLAAAIAGRS